MTPDSSSAAEVERAGLRQAGWWDRHDWRFRVEDCTCPLPHAEYCEPLYTLDPAAFAAREARLAEAERLLRDAPPCDNYGDCRFQSVTSRMCFGCRAAAFLGDR